MIRTMTLVVMTASFLAIAGATHGHSSYSYSGPQGARNTLPERLGYVADAKLLIVHADDLGMAHSSEWRFYRWGPVLSKDLVSSMLDNNGYLYPTESEAASHAKATEVESEIRAQIDRARTLGIKPTLNQNDIVIDRVITIGPNVPADGWPKFYSDAIKSLQPGVTELIVHIAYDDEEMRGPTVDHPDWGAAWRQRDFQFLTSDTFRSLLKENNIKLVTWRQIGRAQYGER